MQQRIGEETWHRRELKKRRLRVQRKPWLLSTSTGGFCCEGIWCKRDRDRGRRRSHSRSRSRSRERKRHARDSASPRRRGDGPDDGNTHEEPKKKKEKKEKKDDGTDHPDPEIAEANRLRASLGLKPLKL